MIKENQSFINGIERVVDVLLNILAVFLAYFVACYFDLQLQINEYRLTIISLILVCVFFMYMWFDIYAPMRSEKLVTFVRKISITNLIIGVILALAFGFWGDMEKPFYLIWIVFSVTFSTVLLIIKKAIMVHILHYIRKRKYNLKHVILIGNNESMMKDYIKQINENSAFGYEILGCLGEVKLDGIDYLGSIDELEDILETHSPDEAIFAFENLNNYPIAKLVNICNDNCVKVMFIPTICNYFKSKRQINQIGDMPLIDIRSTPLENFANRMLKRTIDIVGSLALIILTSPLMIATAIGVKISSPGPILFKQERVGRHNKTFKIYKFRSMKCNTHENSGWTTDHDDRKTKFGNFIRKYSLDELPQFFNVLFGTMSLVGPRPEIPYYVKIFKDQVPLYMVKHYVKPGITGLAQIKGLRGDTSIKARIDEDIYYIENWSIFLDIRILLLTPFKAINKHEKYADETNAERVETTITMEEFKKQVEKDKAEALKIKESSTKTLVQEDSSLKAEKTTINKIRKYSEQKISKKITKKDKIITHKKAVGNDENFEERGALSE